MSIREDLQDEIDRVFDNPAVPDSVRVLLNAILTWADGVESEEETAYREALETVRDWFHDTLYLGRPMRDPLVILRKVESALEGD